MIDSFVVVTVVSLVGLSSYSYSLYSSESLGYSPSSPELYQYSYQIPVKLFCDCMIGYRQVIFSGAVNGSSKSILPIALLLYLALLYSRL